MRDFLLSRELFLSIEHWQGWDDNHIQYPCLPVPENLFCPTNKYFSNPVIILLEITPLNELYFFWITLINELGGEFWLIITSGGSETTGTSDD